MTNIVMDLFIFRCVKLSMPTKDTNVSKIPLLIIEVTALNFGLLANVSQLVMLQIE